MAEIPGAPAAHAIITPTCIANRGVHGALDEAVSRLAEQYHAICDGWKDAPVMPTLHVVLTIERPE